MIDPHDLQVFKKPKMVQSAEEINLTSNQEAIVTAFRKKYPQTTRFTAVKFCFGRKFELNRVIPLYEGYCKVVKTRGLENITVSSVLNELRTQKMYIPGTRDKKGAALFVVKASKHVIGQFPPDSTIKLAFYLGECVTASLKTQRNGITLIIDLTGTEITNFDANFMAEIIGFFQNHIPAAVKNILIWGAPWWIKTAIKVVQPFLKEKMQKRIKLCDNLYGILEYINESDLPVDFGGSFEYDHDYFIRKELSKILSNDVLSALTASQAQAGENELKNRIRSFEMAGATCALSPEQEEMLQKEREVVLDQIDEKIEFLIKNPTSSEDSGYPVPVYDLMQNKIYRLTLDITAEHRPFKTSESRPESSSTNDPLHSAWRKAQFIKNDQERLKIIQDAITNDRLAYINKTM